MSAICPDASFCFTACTLATIDCGTFGPIVPMSTPPFATSKNASVPPLNEPDSTAWIVL